MKIKTKTIAQRIKEETNFLGDKKLLDLLSTAIENSGYNPDGDLSIPDFLNRKAEEFEKKKQENFLKSDISIKQRFENIPEALEEYSLVIKYFLDKYELVIQENDRLKDHLEFEQVKHSRDGKNISRGKMKSWATYKELSEPLLIEMRKGNSFGSALRIIFDVGKIELRATPQSLLNTIPDYCERRKHEGESNPKFKKTEQYKFAIEFLQLKSQNRGKRKVSSIN